MVAVFAQRTMKTIAVDRDAKRSFDLSLYLPISKGHNKKIIFVVSLKLE